MRKETKRNPIVLIFSSVMLLYLVVGLLVRIVLAFFPPEGVSLGVMEVLRAVAVGVVNDAAMGMVLSVPLLLEAIGLNEWKYRRLPGLAILCLLAAAFCYVAFTHSIFHEYGGVVPRIAIGLIGYKLVSFALRFFVPGVRKAWRLVTLLLIWTTYVFIVLFNGVGEWFFWDEFGVRYNFIAVDYLIYTNEVVGNIMESYAMVPIVSVLAVVTLCYLWLAIRKTSFMRHYFNPVHLSVVKGGGIVVATALSLLWLGSLQTHFEGDSLCANQVQQNGAYDFFEAFRNNHLDYEAFYPMLDEAECRAAYDVLTATDTRLLTDTIGTEWQDKVNIPDSARLNVVLITVESLSASFFTAYGNDRGITPCMDTLMQHAMVFDSLYAVGNRTVRGLEALSLCIPPHAGESIVKQPKNKMGCLSTGAVLGSQGYKMQYIYGGDSYFDNMGDYFSGNGYEVIDRSTISQVTFANIWGVCDEDLYRRAIEVFDENSRHGEPFFAQLMTVSNHRPYTFPEGRIEFEGDTKCRAAAVKYTDHAIGQFLSEAATHEWFGRTVFVIIADHCASSAGKTSIPVDKYHIPCIVYAPGMIAPCRVDKMCSQIDILPTLMAMLHINTPTLFTGRNILADNYQQRAFMATYQDLGYLENGVLTVLSPVKKVCQFKVVAQAGGLHKEEPVEGIIDSALVQKAQAYYQYANLYMKPQVQE